MIQNVLEFVEKNSTLVSLITNCLVGCAGFFANKGWKKIKKEYLVKSLRLKRDKDYNIIFPVYKDIQLAHYEKKFDANATNDVLAAINVNKFLQRYNLLGDKEGYVNKTLYDETNETYNIFCIGGFIANDQTEDYFRKVFPKFKVYDNEPERDVPKADMRIFDNSKKGFCWGG